MLGYAVLLLSYFSSNEQRESLENTATWYVRFSTILACCNAVIKHLISHRRTHKSQNIQEILLIGPKPFFYIYKKKNPTKLKENSGL